VVTPTAAERDGAAQAQRARPQRADAGDDRRGIPGGRRARAVAGTRQHRPTGRTEGLRLAQNADGTWGARTLIATLDADARRRALGVTGTLSDGAISYILPVGAQVVYETGGGAASRVQQARAAGLRWYGMFSMGRETADFWSGLSR
jgi:hypothetical protein